MKNFFNGYAAKHFEVSEFDCKCGCGLNNIKPELVRRLDQVREEYGQPIIINSGCRCPEWNEHEGGKPVSRHLMGRAADLRVLDSSERFQLLQICMKYFNRIGVYEYCIHVDIDYHPRGILWVDSKPKK